MRRSLLISTCIALSILLPGCRQLFSEHSGARGGEKEPRQREERQSQTAGVGRDRPDPRLTPGDTLEVGKEDFCVPGYSAKVRDVPEDLKRRVYAEYGITSHRPREYEVDHLISLELGGSNSIKNLWPQSYETAPWNAHVKDQLENDLHRRVCSRQLDLRTAQREIAEDWIRAYKKYLGEPK